MAPVLAVAGVPALIFVIMRTFPHTACAVVVLVAGGVAIMTRDKERRESCHKVLKTLKSGRGLSVPLLGCQVPCERAPPGMVSVTSPKWSVPFGDVSVIVHVVSSPKGARGFPAGSDTAVHGSRTEYSSQA
jgi:hypothetical protein